MKTTSDAREYWREQIQDEDDASHMCDENVIALLDDIEEALSERDAFKAQLAEERRMPAGFKPCESCGRCDQNIRDLLIELEDAHVGDEAMRKRLEAAYRDCAEMRRALDSLTENGSERINLAAEVIALEAKLATINTPEIGDFLAAVEREAKHQRLRWPSDHDEGKTDADWFWLLGWLAGKAVHATTSEKRLHHIITTAAACLNWHAQVIGASSVASWDRGAA